MATQLVEHERIKTTLPKAKALRAVAEQMMAITKRKNQSFAQNAIRATIQTQFARKKLVMELAPRFKYGRDRDRDREERNEGPTNRNFFSL